MISFILVWKDLIFDFRLFEDLKILCSNGTLNKGLRKILKSRCKSDLKLFRFGLKEEQNDNRYSIGSVCERSRREHLSPRRHLSLRIGQLLVKEPIDTIPNIAKHK